MSKVALSGNASGTGTFTIASPNSNTDRTLNLPDASGTILTTATPGVPVNGPAFKAYQTGTQSISGGTNTKIVLDAEVFDTNSCFDSTTNYRFTPTVAGYYQINGRLGIGSATYDWGFCGIFKNGNLVARGSASNTTSFSASTVSDVVYLNGSTDYVEMYAIYSSGVSTENAGGEQFMTYFSGALIRSAT